MALEESERCCLMCLHIVENHMSNKLCPEHGDPYVRGMSKHHSYFHSGKASNEFARQIEERQMRLARFQFWFLTRRDSYRWRRPLIVIFFIGMAALAVLGVLA